MKGKTLLKNNDGSVLVLSMLTLVMLSLIGISATNMSSVEMLISGNDKFKKISFHSADAGVEAGVELLEQNIELRDFDAAFQAANPTITVTTPTIYNNAPTGGNDAPSAASNDIQILAGEPWTDDDGDGIADAGEWVDTNANGNWDPGGDTVFLRIYGVSGLLDGSGLQMIAGYEGKGKSAAGGGAVANYNVRSLATGTQNSQTRVWMRWQHVY